MAIASIGGLWTMSTYVEHIPLAVYGAWLATGNILAWATMVDPGLGMVVQQKVAEAFGNRDHQRVGYLAITGSLVGAAISLLVFLVCAVIIITLPWILGKELPVGGEIQAACWLAAIGSTLTVASYSVTGALLGLQISVSIGIVYLASLTLSLMCQIWLVRSGWGPMGIAIGALIRGVSGLSFNIGIMLLHLKRLKSPIIPSMSAVREIGKSISYTFISRLVGTVASNFDALIITRMIGAESAPVLRTTRAAVDISIGLVNRPAAAVSPVLSHIHGAGEYASKSDSIKRFFQLSAWISMLASGGIFCLNQSFVVIWVGAHLYAGDSTNAVFSLWLVISAIMALFSNVLIALGCFKETSQISAAYSILSTLGSVGMTWKFGIIGIPIALILSSSVVVVWYGWLGIKTGYIPVILRNAIIKELTMGLLASACTAWIIFSFHYSIHTWWEFVMVTSCYVAIYGTVLLIVSKEFRCFVTSLLHRFTRRHH